MYVLRFMRICTNITKENADFIQNVLKGEPVRKQLKSGDFFQS